MVEKQIKNTITVALCCLILLISVPLRQVKASVGNNNLGDVVVVYCDVIGPDLTVLPQTPECYRADNGANIMPVPTDFQFMVSDVFVNSRNGTTNDQFDISIGPGAFLFGNPNGIISEPKIDWNGLVSNNPKLTFNAPYVIVNTGSELAVSNSNTYDVDVRISGYLVPTDISVPTTVTMQTNQANQVTLYPPTWIYGVIIVLLAGLTWYLYSKYRLRE